jgi:hypothetical protein
LGFGPKEWEVEAHALSEAKFKKRARQIRKYSNAIEATLNLSCLHTFGTPGLKTGKELPPDIPDT